ncbi:LysR family transcriptional regulator [Pseudomonas sp. ZM23]|uniref:LysR family transcriptional regulator n=1 Tax=Pseudomonas triclosanedens TaxID=2961893 RepID=A0ABY6ZXZ2_9PSED|nr:LysR family transcriptional regulator [Pseudomonas triclosanedens]MCP8462643.1 LysR family transcriptional regulator [Pseudomonas triclosanedens]MCP8468262.1 LysR family transcriptional regulator [Pseudomonas triclosanedens]MCP8475021.1 LysR family transcriptional regulator [Pseudomonas triclosanedens]WAI49832.1 LysR family transcriptional regulator [Pseudomonas triclosanedens]
MDLRQLRYFIALNEHRSFVRAADAMGITQPAFSRSIQGLEQELGCRLVDRGSKDLRPTPEGQVVLQHALSLVQGATNLSHAIARLNKLDSGEVRFGCGPAPAQKLVSDAVAHFVRCYPGIHIQFGVDNWERLARNLSREEIEFFVADIRHFEADPNFQTRPLKPRNGLFFCRAGHPLLAKDSLSTNDMFAYPLAATLIPPSARKMLANLSGKIDVTANVQCEDMASLVRIVSQTDAIGIAVEEALNEPMARGELVRLHFRNLPHNVDILQARCGIVTRTGDRLSAAARAMIELLLKLDSETNGAVA